MGMGTGWGEEVAEANAARPSYKAGDNVQRIELLSQGSDHPQETHPSLPHTADTRGLWAQSEQT